MIIIIIIVPYFAGSFPWDAGGLRVGPLSVTQSIYASCVIMMIRHQRQWRQQLERSALLAVKRSVGQRGADSRTWGERWGEAVFLLCLLPLQPLLLPLGASVLEPDLHLSFGEAQGRGDGVPLQHRQVVAPLEAVLQHLQLLQGESGADPSAFCPRPLELPLTRSLLLRPAASTCWRMLSGFISGRSSWKKEERKITSKSIYESMKTSLI